MTHPELTLVSGDRVPEPESEGAVSKELHLPSYKQQSPEVRARFRELYERPRVLEVEALDRVFQSPKGPVTALSDVHFEVHQREFICVIGPSGCGKSTLIRILAGLDTPSSGQVLLDGHPVEVPGADRGMVFQRYTLFPWLNVRDNVMFGLRLQGMKRRLAAEKADHWLELVGLCGFSEHYPEQLSGGMKQRVAIARALANGPRILLMDEPFGALDAQTRCSMQAHLLKIWSEVDVTILFITHDLDEAVYLADRIVVLDAHPGRLREVIEVPVPRPRRREQMLSPAFLATKQHVEYLIHPAAEHHEGTDDLDVSGWR